jgi:hypothetical protein
VAASVVGGELTEKSDELPTRKNPNPELLHQHPIADSVHLTWLRGAAHEQMEHDRLNSSRLCHSFRFLPGDPLWHLSCLDQNLHRALYARGLVYFSFA